MKKQFIVTMIVDEKTIAEKNTNYSINYDSVEEYIDRQMSYFANRYENINSLEQGLEEWAEWTEYKEVTKDDVCPINRLLNDACEIITELEHLIKDHRVDELTDYNMDKRLDRFFKNVINLNEEDV